MCVYEDPHERILKLLFLRIDSQELGCRGFERWIEGPWKIVKGIDTIPQRSQITPPSFPNGQILKQAQIHPVTSRAGLEARASGFWSTALSPLRCGQRKRYLNLILKDGQNIEGRKKAKHRR